MKTFDYSRLDQLDRLLAQGCATEVKEFVRRSARDAHRIGLKLLEVKERLGHGRFLAWLEAELGASADTAERLMKVATRVPQIPQGAEIGLTALYLLAANGAGEAAREEAIERAGRGEAITAAKAREIVARHQGRELQVDGAGSPAAAQVVTRSGAVKSDLYEPVPRAEEGVPPVLNEDGSGGANAGGPERPVPDALRAFVAAMVARDAVAAGPIVDSAAAVFPLTRGWSRKNRREVAARVEWAAEVLQNVARRLRRPDESAVG